MFGFTQVPSVDVEEVKKAIDQQEQLVVLDVRTPDEYARGHIEGSINLPVSDIAATYKTVLSDKEQRLFVYCLSGSRSAVAVQELQKLGYIHVFDMKSGLLAWRAKGYKTVVVGQE